MKQFAAISAFFLLATLPSLVFGADSTSYAPPGVTQNRAMDRHNQSITNASTVRANTDMRAPRYYDSQDLNYYVDPASTTMLNQARASIYYDRADPAYYIRPAYTSVMSNAHVNTLFANIMYDKQNTSRYVDPSGTSAMDRIYSYYNNGIPTSSYDVATKKYVDSQGGGPNCVFGASTSYCTWSNGLKYQWGRVSVYNNSNRTVNFGTAFHTTNYYADLKIINARSVEVSSSKASDLLPSGLTTTHFTIKGSPDPEHYGGHPATVMWSAMGY